MSDAIKVPNVFDGAYEQLVEMGLVRFSEDDSRYCLTEAGCAAIREAEDLLKTVQWLGLDLFIRETTP